MKKILLVYNPVSGSAAFKNKLDEIAEAFQRRGILLSLYRTQIGENPEFADFARLSGAEGIIAAGGDGTLHAVINWTKKFSLNLPVGVIGSGTSNDFATHLKIDNLENYFDVIAAGKIRTFDLGLVNGKNYFVNVASAGVFTSIAHEVDPRLKNVLGKPAYYLRGLGEITNFKSFRLKIKADGKIFEEEVFLFLVLNSPAVAGMKKITAAAKIDDGKLDLLAVKKCSPAQLVRLTKKLFEGECVQDEPNILYLQAKNFEIESDTKIISDLDGEIGDPLPLKIETIHEAVTFYSV